MYVVRNVFRCKPGKAKAVIEKFKRAAELMSDGNFDSRILVDEVAGFWTVVLEENVEDLGEFAKNMQEYGSRADVQEAMAGYMDMIDSGYREVFKVA